MDAVSQLTTGITNNFNDLFLVIQEYVSIMLSNTGTSHPHFRYLKTIGKQVSSSADLTRQMRAFVNDDELLLKLASISKIIQKIYSMFWDTGKKISVNQMLERDIWKMKIDQEMIEQVLINLYLNAWQAMPDGGEILVKTENILLKDNHTHNDLIKTGKYVKIAIAAMGMGMGMNKNTEEKAYIHFFAIREKKERCLDWPASKYY
jgi:two-component system cell cycle sensor histidine kinase/response regulator CckA